MVFPLTVAQEFSLRTKCSIPSPKSCKRATYSSSFTSNSGSPGRHKINVPIIRFILIIHFIPIYQIFLQAYCKHKY